MGRPYSKISQNYRSDSLKDIKDLFALTISCLYSQVLLVGRIKSQKHPYYGIMPSISSQEHNREIYVCVCGCLFF